MPKRLKTPLRKAIKVLEDHGHRYAIIGGIALSQWGVVRVTQDVDIKVLVSNLDYAGVRALLTRVFSKPARQHAPQNPFIIAVEIDEVIVDFLLTAPGYEEQIISRAVRRKLNGFPVWVCSAEDLIIQKVIAGRGKDWPDVEALLIEQRGKLDESYITYWLSQFAEALEKPEMLADYQRLVEKIKALK
ncbi:MAG: nucleotidyltransferase [candidate division KSB1 bacterium]|nr:nucleotidyltransferase [candidate division KSB1 bacterium]MDZ7365486.1 nucleotidyltransferase [candidate division KSB1 bacterium]MDZ7403589.1 nucleotidyltransferase [candidate division KSB1 bacterium]